MFRNLIFDWSGTLVDDLGPVIEATNAVFARYQLAAMDREEFRRRFRLPYHEFYRDALPHVALEEIESHFRPAFDGSKSPVFVLPHAAEFLAWCAAQEIRCFVLTSAHTSAFERHLTEFAIAHHFHATYSGAVDKRQVIHQILADHALEKRETALIGDMVHDIETARHGGVTSIAVLTGYDHPEILSAVRPDITVSDLDSLRNLLEHASRPARRPVSTVGALLHRPDGTVLMVRTHKWNNRWGIPGGKIERGETAEAALQREILEETALSIGTPEFVMAQDCIDDADFYRPAHFILLNYLAAAAPGEVQLNQEAHAHRWLTLPEALELDLNRPTRVLLEEILRRNLLPNPTPAILHA